MKNLILTIPACALLTGCETVPDRHMDHTREELLFESGRNAVDGNDLYAAERYFKEVLDLDPGNSEARYYLREVRSVLDD